MKDSVFGNTKFVKSGFYREVKDGICTYLEFIPSIRDTLDEIKEVAKKFIRVSPSSIYFIKRPDGKYTFVPRTGSPDTDITRSIRVCGCEIIDQTFCMII